MLKAAICTAASPVILLLFSHNCRQYHRSKQLCSNIIFTFRFSYFAFSQVWFPTVQDVLHADWQDVWHSPHPPFLTVLFSVCVFSVLMCFIFTPPNFAHIAFAIIAHTARFLKYFFHTSVWFFFMRPSLRAFRLRYKVQMSETNRLSLTKPHGTFQMR